MRSPGARFSPSENHGIRAALSAKTPVAVEPTPSICAGIDRLRSDTERCHLAAREPRLVRTFTA